MPQEKLHSLFMVQNPNFVIFLMKGYSKMSTRVSPKISLKPIDKDDKSKKDSFNFETIVENVAIGQFVDWFSVNEYAIITSSYFQKPNSEGQANAELVS